MSELKFEVTALPLPEIEQAISQGLTAYNESKTEKSDLKALLVYAKNSAGETIGGLIGETLRGWLHIRRLWVSEENRSARLGSQLVIHAEDEAIRRGCLGSYLNTYSFQAQGFYQKLGYEIFGELDDFPLGHQNIFLKKTFRS